MKSALLIVSHGSKSPHTRREVSALAEAMRGKSGRIVHFSFLHLEKPTVSEGIDACLRDGASEIVVLPHFLTSGNHVLEDIPRILREEGLKRPGVRIVTAPLLGLHERMPQLMLDLASRAEPEKGALK